MSRLFALALIVFAVTLAAVVGNRMGGEAMAVVVGVVCGVAASIPMSLLILLVVNRSKHDDSSSGSLPSQARRYEGYPPVVVIQGGSRQEPLARSEYLQYPPNLGSSGSRDFRILGE